MGIIPLYIPRTTKPPLGTHIDWSNPLTKGMVGCWAFNEGGGKKAFNLVSGETNLGGGYPVPTFALGSYTDKLDASGCSLGFDGVQYNGLSIPRKGHDYSVLMSSYAGGLPFMTEVYDQNFLNRCKIYTEGSGANYAIAFDETGGLVGYITGLKVTDEKITDLVFRVAADQVSLISKFFVSTTTLNIPFSDGTFRFGFSNPSRTYKLIAVFDHPLSNNESFALTQNPWQIFEPEIQYVDLGSVSSVDNRNGNSVTGVTLNIVESGKKSGSKSVVTNVSTAIVDSGKKIGIKSPIVTCVTGIVESTKKTGLRSPVTLVSLGIVESIKKIIVKSLVTGVTLSIIDVGVNPGITNRNGSSVTNVATDIVESVRKNGIRSSVITVVSSIIESSKKVGIKSSVISTVTGITDVGYKRGLRALITNTNVTLVESFKKICKGSSVTPVILSIVDVGGKDSVFSRSGSEVLTVLAREFIVGKKTGVGFSVTSVALTIGDNELLEDIVNRSGSFITSVLVSIEELGFKVGRGSPVFSTYIDSQIDQSKNIYKEFQLNLNTEIIDIGLKTHYIYIYTGDYSDSEHFYGVSKMCRNFTTAYN